MGTNQPSVETILPKRQTSQLNQRLYKVVLTGGPCGGKTTGQDRLATFFENLGWKVYRVPETATVLLKGGIRFAELSDDQVFKFQEDLLLSLIKIEDTFFHLAESWHKNCLVICDRGTYDPSAYISAEGWNRILEDNHLNAVDLRDSRYNQIVHMVTAANGAEEFYTTSNNLARTETVEEAKAKDAKTSEVWVGHPYIDVVDNRDCSTFEDKMLKLIQVVCDRMGVEYGDRLAKNSRKRKFLVIGISESKFPSYQEFQVVHDYLHSDEPGVQARIRKRGQGGRWSHTHTVRRDVQGEKVETRMQLSDRQYKALRAHKDFRRSTTYKTRRCFMYKDRYYQLDIYQTPLPPQCPSEGTFMMLETYTTNTEPELPDIPNECLQIAKEVTADPAYSMYNMSLRHDATPGATSAKTNFDFAKTPTSPVNRKTTCPPSALESAFPELSLTNQQHGCIAKRTSRPSESGTASPENHHSPVVIRPRSGSTEPGFSPKPSVVHMAIGGIDEVGAAGGVLANGNEQQGCHGTSENNGAICDSSLEDPDAMPGGMMNGVL